MALTINQEPTSPNMANADLLFVVESPTTSSFPQYQFVADIYEGGNKIQRIKQQPNPSGYGVFNVGQIVSQFEDSDNIWKITTFTTSSECNKSFGVKFGEEYASSISGSIILYDGLGSMGNPALTSSAEYNITNGLVDFPSGHNFASQSYYSEQDALDDVIFTSSSALTNAPRNKGIQAGEYETISIYNANANTIENPTFAQDVFSAIYKQYDSAGTLLQTDTLVNTFVGLRTTPTEDWASVANLQNASNRLIHVPSGYQNIIDAGVSIDANASYYTITLHPQGTDRFTNENAIWDSFTYTLENKECSYDGVRFAWKNEFGVWDYYTFTLQSSANSTIVRDSYKQTLVDFSTETSTTSLQGTRRGETQFYNEISREKTANSNWLTQAEADWLRELFYSTDVFIQNGSDFYPAVITSANFVEKTNPRTQKQFQYQLSFKDANQLRARI